MPALRLPQELAAVAAERAAHARAAAGRDLAGARSQRDAERLDYRDPERDPVFVPKARQGVFGKGQGGRLGWHAELDAVLAQTRAHPAAPKGRGRAAREGELCRVTRKIERAVDARGLIVARLI